MQRPYRACGRAQHERTGRPLGSEKFIATLERLAGRMLRRQKPGPKKRKEG